MSFNKDFHTNDYSSLYEWLWVVCDTEVRFNAADLDIACSSAALLGDADKRRLRLLEAAGDNALSMAVVTECLRLGESAQTYQTARSQLTSNVHEASVFVNLGLTKYVKFASGVSPLGNAGADALEAIVGLIYDTLGMDGVMLFCRNIKYFSAYSAWRS